ncbi:MAG: hypothetical protein KDA41_05940, partial [Planctomycetales bacterium]|nr:hypothetical protein [Planctomycetales bacterium]
AGARLEVEAEHAGGVARMSTRVQVEKIRYATQLAADKPLYRPGETLRFRSLTLTRFGLQSDRELPVRVRLEDPAGGVVAGSEHTGYTNRGVAGAVFSLPPHLAGGTYTLVVASGDADPAFPEERRDVFVRQYRLPRLKKELEFTRDSYAPGSEVVADFLAERAEGGPAADAQLAISAVVDGEAVHQASAQADADCRFQLKFTLPATIEKGQATLAVVVDDGGNRETIAKTIPIHLGKAEVDFYPEGGDLVAGLESRVYFFAHNPLGEPLDIRAGRVVDDAGREVARVSTYHEGRGAFRFTPAADAKYRLEIIDPPNMEVAGPLPSAVGKAAFVMHTGDGVFGPGAPITVDVLSRQADVPLVVTAVCRGTQVAQQELLSKQAATPAAAQSAEARVAFDLPLQVSGVVRLTLYDFRSTPPKPVAERLVYRRPAQRLNIRLADGPVEFSPGERASLSLEVTDERGQPQPAALGVTVVDEALLNLADAKTPSLPTYFYLASEIEKPEDLEDANFYLLAGKQDDKDPAQALDMLLGTQGWRRFVQLTSGDVAGLTAQSAPETPSGENVATEEAANDEELARIAAVDRLVAMEGPQQFPTLYDNAKQVNEQFASQMQSAADRRAEHVAAAGRVCFFGGAALLLAVAMLAVLQLVREPRYWAPAGAAALGALAMGGLWMSAKVDADGRLALRGFAGFDASRLVAQVIPSTESATETTPAADDFDEAKWKDNNGDGPFPFAEEEAPADAERLAEGLDDLAPGEDLAAHAAVLELGDIAAEEKVGLDFEFDKRERFRFQLAPLNEQGQQLLKELGGADQLRRLLDGKAEINGDNGWLFYDIAGDGEIWFDGTVADVARMRTLWHRAGRLDDDKAALALGKAYEQLLAQYQLPLRQYAHTRSAEASDVRSDFTEVLFWNPLLIADEHGRAAVEFDLSDSVTTFIVAADAHGAGRIGAGGGEIVSRIPFSLEPK